VQEAGPAADIYVEQYLNGMDPFLFAGTYHESASWFGGLMGYDDALGQPPIHPIRHPPALHR